MSAWPAVRQIEVTATLGGILAHFAEDTDSLCLEKRLFKES